LDLYEECAQKKLRVWLQSAQEPEDGDACCQVSFDTATVCREQKMMGRRYSSLAGVQSNGGEGNHLDHPEDRCEIL
jgi:hypothetical protein